MSTNSQPPQYRDRFYDLAPPWLRTGNGEKYLYALNLCSDILLDRMNQATKFRLPGQGDPSQLPYLANDRVLVQGPAETNAAFVTRLQNAYSAWKIAGSRVAIMQQIQAYLSNLQPGVAANLPEMTIVGGSYSTVNTWDTLYQGDLIGATPTRMNVTPGNFNWDGKTNPWRSWLILYMSRVSAGLSGSAAQTSTTSGGSYNPPGQNVSGVWVPTTSGGTYNSPVITITNLSGITMGNVGMWLTLSGSSNPGNNGTFPIISYVSGSSVTIMNPSGVGSDTGPLTWSISYYPFIGPGPQWGTPGYTFGEGQTTSPPKDTGANIGGVWQPSTSGGAGYGATLSWGLTCSSNTIQSIRQLLQRWKSAASYYPNIIISFDGGDSSSGSAYSPNSTPGSGNPDGTFGSVGAISNGVWVPTRKINSSFDAFCQGTGYARACSIENVT